MSLNQLISNRRKRFLKVRVEELKSDTNISLLNAGNEVDISAASGTTSYSLVLPGSQASAANEVLLNDGSGNLTWGEGGGQQEKQSGSLDIYINSSTGNDSNDGLSSGQAVATFGRAINVAVEFSYEELIFNVEASMNINEQSLPIYNADGNLFRSLDFTTISNLYSVIVVLGTRNVLDVSDSVDTVSNISPFNQWKRITADTGGYFPSGFAGLTLFNNTKKKYSRIQDNTSNTIDLIGDNAEAGDSFNVFNTNISLGHSDGVCILAHTRVEIREINFASSMPVFFNAGVAPLYLRGVQFGASVPNQLHGNFEVEGCRFEDGGFDGTMKNFCGNFDSLYATVSFTINNDCQMKDIYCFGSTISFDRTVCHIQNMYSDNGAINRSVITLNDTSAILTCNNLFGRSDTTQNGINILESSFARFTNLDLETFSATCMRISGNCAFEGAVTLVGPNIGGKYNIRSSGGGEIRFATAGLNSTSSSSFSGCPRCIELKGGRLVVSPQFDMTFLAATDNCIHASEESSIVYNPSLNSFDSPGTAVVLESVSNLASNRSGFLNVGAGQPLKVGANAAGAWTTNADLTTEYCIAYTG